MFNKHRVSKIISPVEWMAVQKENKCYVVELLMTRLLQTK